jgi:FKBP-type peptidyl-prolyl cis-trans isomerase FklB
MQPSIIRLTHLASVAMTLLVVASFASAQDTPPQAGADAVASHDLGLIFGNQLRNGGLTSTLSLDALMQGVKEGLNGKPVSPQVKQRVTLFLRTGHEALAGRNKAAAVEFLTKNAKAEGVTTTTSGLQYKVISTGDAKAASPGANDQVTVQYRGMLLDGSEFDSSYAHGQPASFRLNGVIKGWQEALLLMKPGAKWQLFVAPELAYDTQSPPGIPPGSLLVFDVELIKAEPQAMVSQSSGQAPDAPQAVNAPKP